MSAPSAIGARVAAACRCAAWRVTWASAVRRCIVCRALVEPMRRALLRRHGVTPGMSRAGNPYAHAALDL